jgi:nucleoside-diphosphate-sugar epimerase
VIYVKDAADAYILLAENLEKVGGECFNVASKNVMSVLEIIERTSNALKIAVKAKILNEARAEIPIQHLDGGKIKNMLGWEAKTSFEESIRETFQWYSGSFIKE